MMIKDLVHANRSYRRFDENQRISREQLREWVSLARISASATNAQGLRFALYESPEDCRRIFPALAWAGYLKNWPGPAEGERPAAYIFILGAESHKYAQVDAGIAMQSILLGAVQQGFGGCIIGSVNRKLLEKAYPWPRGFHLLYVVALGKPNEQVVMDTMQNPDQVEYWRDENHVHHVPKRPLDDLIIN